MCSIPRWRLAVCATSDSVVCDRCVCRRARCCACCCGRCVGTEIPNTSNYPHTDANTPTYVVLGIPNTSNYPHTNANTPTCVGTEIPNTSNYPQTNANTLTYVGLGIPSAYGYSRTDANARGESQTYGGERPGIRKTPHLRLANAGFGLVYRSDDCLKAIIRADFTQATIIGSTGTPGFIVEVMVALVT